jgi:hypothetical protein
VYVRQQAPDERMLNIGKRPSRKSANDCEADRRGAERAQKRKQNAGAPAVDGYGRSHKKETGNAKQLP